MQKRLNKRTFSLYEMVFKKYIQLMDSKVTLPNSIHIEITDIKDLLDQNKLDDLDMAILNSKLEWINTRLNRYLQTS